MYILGISAFYHDSAACLIFDGEIVAAAQEERFSRKKNDSSFPKMAIKYCLEEAKIVADNIDKIVFYEKPFLKFERLVETYLAFAPNGFSSFCKAIPLWIKEKLFLKRFLVHKLNQHFSSKRDWHEVLLFSEHHVSHAASAFFPSPFESAAILTLDGVGEWTTTSIAVGKGNEIKIQKEMHFPHSIGLLYSAFTYYTGFKVNSGEYKVMGLAPYGEPKYANLIFDNLINQEEDGSFWLDMSYFDYPTGLTMTNDKFHNLFGGPPREPNSPILQRHMDLAASIQTVTEKLVLKIAQFVATSTGEKNLCLAGGVALNCVANGRLLKEKIFEQIWVQPAAGDAGGALGAALAAWHLHFSKPRATSDDRDNMKGSYLGPRVVNTEVQATLAGFKAHFIKLNEEELIEQTATALCNQKTVAWMQGRMEFGPRALGARSILADPRSATMQKQLNLKVKFRESFRPFAPSILAEDVADWFDDVKLSPYMLFVTEVAANKQIEMTHQEKKFFGIEKLNVCRSLIPAVTHVDYSARIQTVHEDTNPIYYKLIGAFKAKTGCPLVVNTSFNIRGEPVVCTTEDAYRCFMSTDLDVLVIGNCILHKEDQFTQFVDW